MSPPPSDPWIAAKIEAALERHGGQLTERQKAAFREKMAWTLATHPAAQRLIERERPAHVDRSGERLAEGAEEKVDTEGDRTGLREKKRKGR